MVGNEKYIFRLWGKKVMGLKCLSGKRLLNSLVIAMWLFPLGTFAQSLDSYCLTKPSNSKAPEFKAIDHSKEPAPQVTFAVKGQTFRAIPDPKSNHRIKLIDAQNNQVDEVWAHQPEAGGFNELILGKNGWLWIDGMMKDYIVRIDLNQSPPKFGGLQNLPELYNERHSYLWRWFEGYSYGYGKYSRNLDRVFVTGYPLSILGVPIFGWPSKKSYEIVDGKTKLLPEVLWRATLYDPISYHHGKLMYEDFPGLGGVLFRSASGDALFYDGEKVTSLFENYKNTNGLYPKWYAHALPAAKQTLIEASINNIQIVFELTTDHKLKKRLVVPDEIIGGGDFMFSRFFIFPEDQRLFVLSGLQSSILTEVDGLLRAGLIIKKPWHLRELRESNTKGVLSFIVSKGNGLNIPSNFEAREYSLVPAKSKTHCLGYFNVAHPFELAVK
jgi:hypothetical protein